MFFKCDKKKNIDIIKFVCLKNKNIDLILFFFVAFFIMKYYQLMNIDDSFIKNIC